MLLNKKKIHVLILNRTYRVSQNSCNPLIYYLNTLKKYWCEFRLYLDSIWVQLKILKILCNDACERPSSWEHLWRYFSDSWQNLSSHPHCRDILRSTSCLVEVVYWPCGLKLVYPIINLAFLGKIVKVPVKFCLHNFEWFCLQISTETKYFSSLVQSIVIGD